MSSAILVYCTTSSQKEAQRIGKTLVAEKLAACVSIVPGVLSHYWWQGKVDKAREWILLIKTQRRLFKALSARIHSLHSYTVPEVIAVPIAMGSPKYLSWMAQSLKG